MWIKIIIINELHTICCIKNVPGVDNVKKYQCSPCQYIYDPKEGDPDNGVPPGTAFEDLPDDWICPLCGVSKDLFEEK